MRVMVSLVKSDHRPFSEVAPWHLHCPVLSNVTIHTVTMSQYTMSQYTMLQYTMSQYTMLQYTQSQCHNTQCHNTQCYDTHSHNVTIHNLTILQYTPSQCHSVQCHTVTKQLSVQRYSGKPSALQVTLSWLYLWTSPDRWTNSHTLYSNHPHCHSL